MKQLVLISGGFHPFHPGHLSLYQAAKETFPSADVVVAATNDTSSRPFDFKIKLDYLIKKALFTKTLKRTPIPRETKFDKVNPFPW